MLDFETLFEYDAWANREVLAAMRKAGVPPRRSVELLSHIVAAGKVWLCRIRQVDQKVVVWPSWSLDEVQEELSQVAREWGEFVRTADQDVLSKSFSYVNSKGEAFTSQIGDTLTHVIMHGAYHRGQIASDMRANGIQPASTDFIIAVRQGLLTRAQKA